MGGLGRRSGLTCWLAVLAGLAAVAALKLATGQAVGLSFLSVVPIGAAALVLGRNAAVASAGIATGLFIVTELLSPSPELEDGRLALATISRAAVFLLTALVVAELGVRQRRATQTLEEGQRELGELRALRDALTPPSLPTRPGLQLGVAFTPADGLVAGDFFLVAGGIAGSTTLVVGDVVGHGLDAARRAAFVRATLSTFLLHEDDPARLFMLANRALLERHGPAEDFVTAVCATITPDGRLRWASAGHWPPWDLDRGRPLPGGHRSAPLGFDADLHCVTERADLAQGDGVLFYTDGLVEARSRAPQPDRRRFGEDAAQAALRRHRGEPPAAIAAALQNAALSFAGGSLADDLCVLAVRRSAE